MYGSRSEATFRYWENVFYQHRLGLFDETEYRAALKTMEAIIERNEGFKRYWCQDSGRFSEPFRDEINRIVAVGSC